MYFATLRDNEDNILMDENGRSRRSTTPTAVNTGGTLGGPQVIESSAGVDATSFCWTVDYGRSNADTCANRPAPTGMRAAMQSEETGGRLTGQEETGTPATLRTLTAQFVDMPLTRDTATDFTIVVRFSETFVSDVSYQAFSNTLNVDDGTLKHVERFVKTGDDRNRRWRMTVTPSAAGQDVTLTVPPTLAWSATNAICAQDDTPLAVGLAL